MSSILNVSSVAATQPRPVQPAPTAAATNAQQPTLTQLLEEPAFELQLQAQEGDTQAATLFAQLQQSNAYLAPAGTGPGTLTGGLAIDFLA